MAWSCDIGGVPAAAISVGIPANGNESGAFIFYANTDDTIYYGTQAAFMQTSWAPFTTVQDNDDKSGGPAYYFQQFYDKVVVLPESALAVPSSKMKKRRSFPLNAGWLQHKQAAQPSQKPWFCVWNNTFVEGFIYVDEAIATTYSVSSGSAQATASANASSSSSSPAAVTTSSSAGALPTDYITTTITKTSTTATYTGPVSSYSVFASRLAEQATDDDDDNDNGHSKRQFTEDDLYNTLAMYPYVVKIEERRLAGNTVNPYCQQYQILDDGSYNWVAGSNGEPIIIELDEQDPSYSAYQSAGLASNNRKLKERRLVAGGCHCQWLSGQHAT